MKFIVCATYDYKWPVHQAVQNHCMDIGRFTVLEILHSDYMGVLQYCRCGKVFYLILIVVFMYFHFQGDSSSSVMIITSYWFLSVRVPKAVIQSSVF